MHAFTMRSMKWLTLSREIALLCLTHDQSAKSSIGLLSIAMDYGSALSDSDPPGSEIDRNGSRMTGKQARGVDKGERACGQKRSPVLADS